MRRKKLLEIFFLIIISIIYSCAGMPFFTGAGQEFEQGLTKFNLGKYTEAIPHFTKATELDSEYTDAYLYLGRCYLSLARWIEAVPPLRTAHRLSPGKTEQEILNLLFDAVIGAAGHEFRIGNFGSSINYLKEGLILVPGSEKAKVKLTESLIALGGKSISEGNFHDAIPIFKEALSLSPNNFDAYIGIAKAFLNNGDYINAIDAAKKALEIYPGSEEAISLIRQLLLNK